MVLWLSDFYALNAKLSNRLLQMRINYRSGKILSKRWHLYDYEYEDGLPCYLSWGCPKTKKEETPNCIIFANDSCSTALRYLMSYRSLKPGLILAQMIRGIKWLISIFYNCNGRIANSKHAVKQIERFIGGFIQWSDFDTFGLEIPLLRNPRAIHFSTDPTTILAFSPLNLGMRLPLSLFLKVRGSELSFDSFAGFFCRESWAKVSDCAEELRLSIEMELQPPKSSLRLGKAGWWWVSRGVVLLLRRWVLDKSSFFFSDNPFWCEMERCIPLGAKWCRFVPFVIPFWRAQSTSCSSFLLFDSAIDSEIVSSCCFFSFSFICILVIPSISNTTKTRLNYKSAVQVDQVKLAQRGIRNGTRHGDGTWTCWEDKSMLLERRQPPECSHATLSFCFKTHSLASHSAKYNLISRRSVLWRSNTHTYCSHSLQAVKWPCNCLHAFHNNEQRSYPTDFSTPQSAQHTRFKNTGGCWMLIWDEIFRCEKIKERLPLQGTASDPPVRIHYLR